MPYIGGMSFSKLCIYFAHNEDPQVLKDDLRRIGTDGDALENLMVWIGICEVEKKNNPDYWAERAGLYQAIKDHLCKELCRHA